MPWSVAAAQTRDAPPGAGRPLPPQPCAKLDLDQDRGSEPRGRPRPTRTTKADLAQTRTALGLACLATHTVASQPTVRTPCPVAAQPGGPVAGEGGGGWLAGRGGISVGGGLCRARGGRGSRRCWPSSCPAPSRSTRRQCTCPPPPSRASLAAGSCTGVACLATSWRVSLPLGRVSQLYTGDVCSATSPIPRLSSKQTRKGHLRRRDAERAFEAA